MNADTAEKCFHNALIIIDCCRKIGLDYDINSLDITDPNSISMVLFSAYLFNKLPNYIPNSNIDFTSPLHQLLSKQVSFFVIAQFLNLNNVYLNVQIKISNPSNKNIFYEVLIVGPNADNFSLPKGKDLPIPAKGRANLHVDFLGNNLKPGNAYLILVGRKKESMVADTIVFCMNASIDELTAKVFKSFI